MYIAALLTGPDHGGLTAMKLHWEGIFMSKSGK